MEASLAYFIVSLTILLFLQSVNSLEVDLEVSEKDNSRHLPVCVIGSSINGVSAALALKNKGYDVILFEGQDYVGGKIRTFRQNKLQIDLSPNMLFTAWDTSVLKYINKFNLTKVPFNINDYAQLDPFSGEIIQAPTLSVTQATEIVDAVKRYQILRAHYAKGLDFEFVHASPDLFVSMWEWMEKRKLTALKDILIPLITVRGYGSLTEVSAVYVLKFFDDNLAKAILERTTSSVYFTVKEGLDVLVNKMAASLKVTLNKRISHIETNQNHQVLHFGKNEPTQKCHKVVFTFTPLLSILGNLIDWSKEDINVLKNIRQTIFSISANYIPSLSNSIYTEKIRHGGSNEGILMSFPKGEGEVVALLKQSANGEENIYTSYSWIKGDFDKPAAIIQIQKMNWLRDSLLHKLDKRSKTYASNAGNHYFPHVTIPALQDGFFQKFNKLQGKQGIFFCTVLLSFNDMNNAITLGEDFVNKYF